MGKKTLDERAAVRRGIEIDGQKIASSLYFSKDLFGFDIIPHLQWGSNSGSLKQWREITDENI
jgi:hypothetical protein